MFICYHSGSSHLYHCVEIIQMTESAQFVNPSSTGPNWERLLVNLGSPSLCLFLTMAQLTEQEVKELV